MPAPNEIPVLIVGAGPVGLALALDLAWRGVRSTVVEQETRQEIRAKAGTLSERSVEFCRRWGIVDRIVNAGFPEDFPGDIAYCTTLAGHFIGRDPLPSARERATPPGSPEKIRRCPQLWFDPILAEEAARTGLVALRFGHRFERHDEDADGIVATVTEVASGAASLIRADYLVACDGAGSGIRRRLGIAFDGNDALSFSVSALIRIPDFLRQHDKGAAERYLMVDQSGVWSNLTCVDGRDLWRFTLIGSEEKLDLERLDMPAQVRKAFGRDDVAFEIVGILPWRRSACVARHWRAGRIFLAGDSAHTMSPTGGFGMNTGLQDAVDLSWKIDAAIRGWAGEQLLDSYGVERALVAARNIAASTRNFNTWVGGKLDWTHVAADGPGGAESRRQIYRYLSDSLREEWRATGVSLGYRYRGSPIVIGDGTPEPPDDPSDYVQTSRPGHRAPHAWMADGRSTIDLFGRGFVLLRFGSTPPDAAAFMSAAKQRGVPLTIVDIDNPGIARLYERALVLVRPDGHVAWRGDHVPDNVPRVLDIVRGATAQV